MSIIDIIESLKKERGSGEDWDIREEFGNQVLVEKIPAPDCWPVRIIPMAGDFNLIWVVKVIDDNNNRRAEERADTTRNDAERSAVGAFYDDIIRQKEKAPTT